MLASGGLVLVLAGAGAGALDPLGTALGVAAAVIYSTYILTSEGVAARVGPLAAQRAGLHRRGDDADRGRRRRRRPATRAASAPPASAGWRRIAVVSTVGAVGLFFAGLRRVGPTTASILSTAEPLVTVVLAFLAFGESLGAVQLPAGRSCSVRCSCSAPPVRRPAYAVG